MKIEEGMWIRTDKGYISKVIELSRNYTTGRRLIDSCTVKKVQENYLHLRGNQCEFVESIDYLIPPCYPTDEELEKIESHIIKASHNIIDLIEVGDYVNGLRVNRIEKDGNGKFLTIGSITNYISKNDINPFLTGGVDGNNERLYKFKLIVTRERFESMEYRIGD